MKDFWKVTSNTIGGEKYYSVFRNIRPFECDHPGNREYACGWISDKGEAERLCQELNLEVAHGR